MTAQNPPTRTALVTGATSGIGLAIARLLAEKGYRVIGTSRDTAAIGNDVRIPAVTYLPLDLADEASLATCAQEAGPVDILVNNAGESQSGPLEDLPADALSRLFKVNVLGPVRLTQLVLPHMRQQRYGRVVMIGSMLGTFPLAYRSSYSASKAAIRTFATAARAELSPYGVWLTTVEPGSVNTGISQRRTKYVAAGSPYAAECARVIEHLDHFEETGVSPGQVAETVLDAIEADRPRALYARGSNAPLAFALKRLAPESVVLRAMSRRFGLRR